MNYATETPLMMIEPEKIRVVQVPMNVMVRYQKKMSRAVWRPAPGRKIGFTIVQGDALLGVIALTSPVIRMEARDKFLCPDASDAISRGIALRSYMDMSVCVAAQPIGWYWNIGKLLALVAPTLGDFVHARYPDDEFKGVITTSLWGKSVQYNRVYRMLGFTKGFGHEHVSDEDYDYMCSVLRASGLLSGCRFEDGSNTRLRRIAAYRKLTGDKSITLHHGQQRGIYYHAAVPPEQRTSVIQQWYERWGLPRYERQQKLDAPYQSGLEEAA
jgi:hypothetical protein